MSSKQWIVAIHHPKYLSCLFSIHFRSHTDSTSKDLCKNKTTFSQEASSGTLPVHIYIYTPVKKYCLNSDGYLKTLNTKNIDVYR